MGTGYSQASTVMRAPAVAPAAPKHTIVAIVGVLPGRLTTTRGSSPPVALPMAAEYLYLNFWYREKDVVRTRVTLNTGAKAPIGEFISPSSVKPGEQGSLTPPESLHSLCSVGVVHAVSDMLIPIAVMDQSGIEG